MVGLAVVNDDIINLGWIDNAPDVFDVFLEKPCVDRIDEYIFSRQSASRHCKTFRILFS